MDRVSEALARARKERVNVPIVPVRQQSLVNRQKLATLEYKRTRKFSPDPGILHRNLVVTGGSDPGLATAFKLLRTQILQTLSQNGWSTLAVTSPGAHEGKTFTAVNLATTLAQEVDRTVLLVEADLRAPALHRYFGFPRGKGLSDFLLDNVPLGELLLHPEIGRLVLLPGGATIPNSSELLRSPLMTGLVRELKSRYKDRIVIFDLPPVLTASDTLAFSPLVEATLLVVQEGKTRADQLERAVQLLEGSNLVGMVLNKSHEVEAPAAERRGWLARVLGSTKG